MKGGQNGVSRSDVLLTYLQIYDPRRRKIDSPPPLIVSISFLQNGVVHATHEPIRISEEDEGETGERSIPFAMLTPLKRFPPGDYDLRIRVEEQGTNRSLFREVPLRIVAAEPGQQSGSPTENPTSRSRRREAMRSQCSVGHSMK